jgi:hypothetical protein
LWLPFWKDADPIILLPEIEKRQQNWFNVSRGKTIKVEGK